MEGRQRCYLSRAVEARVKGGINQKDFEVLRDGITVKVETIEAQLRELRCRARDEERTNAAG